MTRWVRPNPACEHNGGLMMWVRLMGGYHWQCCTLAGHRTLGTEQWLTTERVEGAKWLGGGGGQLPAHWDVCGGVNTGTHPRSTQTNKHMLHCCIYTNTSTLSGWWCCSCREGIWWAAPLRDSASAQRNRFRGWDFFVFFAVSLHNDAAASHQASLTLLYRLNGHWRTLAEVQCHSGDSLREMHYYVTVTPNCEFLCMAVGRLVTGRENIVPIRQCCSGNLLDISLFGNEKRAVGSWEPMQWATFEKTLLLRYE